MSSSRIDTYSKHSINKLWNRNYTTYNRNYTTYNRNYTTYNRNANNIIKIKLNPNY